MADDPTVKTAKGEEDEESTISRFELNGEILEIDMSELTFGEVEYVEMYFNRSFEDIDWESGRGVLMIAALAKSRKNQRLSIAEAMDSFRDVKVNKVEEAKVDRPTTASADSGTPD